MNQMGPSREMINKFMEDVAYAISGKPAGEVEMPWLEAPRVLIEYFNKGKMAGFEDVQYFVFSGVKVAEEGKLEEAQIKDSRSTEQVMHGRR